MEQVCRMALATYWQPSGTHTHRLRIYCFMFTNMTNNNRGRRRVGEMTEIQLFDVGAVLDIRSQTGPGAAAATLRSQMQNVTSGG